MDARFPANERFEADNPDPEIMDEEEDSMPEEDAESETD